jgi:hypothetical protein
MHSDIVGCIDECNWMVVIHTDSRSALTAPCMTGTLSLSQTLLVNSVSDLHCVFSLICKTQDDIMLIDRQSTRFGVLHCHVARMTLAHAQTNYHVSQFGH